MQNETAREAIERLEDEIERLAVRRERCRKVSLTAKTAIAAGAVWLVLTLTGLVPSAPSLFFASLAAIIGGIVLLGSNATTWEQIDAALAKAEAARAQLIGAIELRVVDGGVRQMQ
jgi:predicted nucleic acid-binding protein